jgi:hypothetical protein
MNNRNQINHPAPVSATNNPREKMVALIQSMHYHCCYCPPGTCHVGEPVDRHHTVSIDQITSWETDLIQIFNRLFHSD